MSRWRPPQKPASAYITPTGYQSLETELDQLWKKRRIVNDALAAAAAEGDRSENAEYQYRKKEQAGIDRRIRYLQKRMPELTIVTQVASTAAVYFGAFVTVDIDGELSEYRVVGADETDLEKRWISIDSPLAQFLLKKTIGDGGTVSLGAKRAEVYVEAIRYE